MARTAKKIANTQADGRPRDLVACEAEANDRLKECRSQKALYVADFREAYFFAAPHRMRSIATGGSNSAETKPEDAGEAATSIACELTDDFTTFVLDSFMPQAEAWCERRPGMFLPEAVKEEAKKKIREQDPIIFEAIRASNFYAELPKCFTPDLGIGTFGMWIDDPRPAENIVTQAVPLGELECNLGPFGTIDDRFAVRKTKYRLVPAVLGRDLAAKLPHEIRTKIENEPNAHCEVVWGFWRLWERYDDVVWKKVVMVDDMLIHHEELIGEGSCNLIVGRFNPPPDSPFGNGPLLRALPDLRQYDENEAQKTDAIEMAIAGPVTYPNDSFAAIEDGIEARAAYPVRPGDEQAVKKIYEPSGLDAAIFANEALERRLKKLFYVDKPQQRGDTPPTATQWLDEMVMGQKQIGTPGLSFWLEGPAEFFLRFKYLLEQRGQIEPIKVDGKTVSIQPYNPAQRAAEQQEVAMATRAMAICAQAFPEEFKAMVDGRETMKAIVEKMRANLIKFRDQKDVQAAVGILSQLTEGRLIAPKIDPAQAGQL